MTHGELLLNQLAELSVAKSKLYEEVDKIERYECGVIRALLDMGVKIEFPFKSIETSVKKS